MWAALRPAKRRSRFGFDYRLVCSLMDRWRPETHSFHFPWVEMAVTLEDVVLLFGLPCSGEPMGRHPRKVRRSGAPSRRARGA
jgi:hypothetical protein